MYKWVKSSKFVFAYDCIETKNHRPEYDQGCINELSQASFVFAYDCINLIQQNDSKCNRKPYI